MGNKKPNKNPNVQIGVSLAIRTLCTQIIGLLREHGPRTKADLSDLLANARAGTESEMTYALMCMERAEVISVNEVDLVRLRSAKLMSRIVVSTH